MATFTREQLNGMTSDELKRMCVQDLHIVGMTKKRKEVIVDAIMQKQDGPATGSATPNPVKVAPASSGPITGMEFTGRSVFTKPSSPFGQRATTTIHVSCGASSGNFPVIGRTVTQVGEFLREVLNVDQLSTGLVNGKQVPGDHILTQGDNLEFLKPAGKKGF
jgi:hypothetical protein